MHTLAKFGVKLLLVTLILIKPLYASDHDTLQADPFYTVKYIKILPLPDGFINLRIVCPGTRYATQPMWISDHRNATLLPLPSHYKINNSEVEIQDLTAELGMKKLVNHNLTFKISQREKREYTTVTMERIFDVLRNGSCYEFGVYTMVITFSTDDPQHIGISYELCDPSR